MEISNLQYMLGQALGVCLTGVTVYGLTRKCDKQFRKMGRWGAFLDSIHWALLGAQTGALIALLITVRVWAAEYVQGSSSKVKWSALAVFTAIFTAAMVATWKGPVSMLPWLAVLNASYAYFFTTGIKLRGLFVLTNACWIGYAVIIGSVGGMATSSIATAVGIATVWRARRAAAIAA